MTPQDTSTIDIQKPTNEHLLKGILFDLTDELEDEQIQNDLASTCANCDTGSSSGCSCGNCDGGASSC
ncbi:hypothetical protein N2599_17055 [Rhizobium sullae]|uniref:FxLD family lantipeptide n=1 Tax=Rhizobium sullae TaxID=50338 RepID=A0ABY5XIP7_RHISU|nr:hypothetical protein [Rhizobium sullae]UWU13823.1 hypothetical protein N2599_17055 [Rhizobium sullae]